MPVAKFLKRHSFRDLLSVLKHPLAAEGRTKAIQVGNDLAFWETRSEARPIDRQRGGLTVWLRDLLESIEHSIHFADLEVPFR